MHIYQMNLMQLPADVMAGTNAPVWPERKRADATVTRAIRVTPDVAKETRDAPQAGSQFNWNPYYPNHMQWTNTGILAQVPDNYCGVRVGYGIPKPVLERINDVPQYGCKPLPASKYHFHVPPPSRLYHV